MVVNDPAPSNKKWCALSAVGLGVLMATLDVSIVNVSLPTLVAELKTDFPTIQWVIISYVLVLTSLTLGVARLGDMMGKKKLYVLGLAVFTCGSLLCGLAPSVRWLIGFRALQGLGAVMTQSLGAAIVTEVFPSYERGKALGVIGGIVAVGLSLGPAVGGILIGLVGWRSVFLVNVPIGALALFFAVRYIPMIVPTTAGQRFDLIGAVVMMLTLVCYAAGMTLGQATSFRYGPVIFLLLSAFFGLIVFILTEKHRRQPILDLTLFRDALFSLNLIMGLLVFITLSTTFVLPFFLELVVGLSTYHVGLLMMVVPVTMGVMAPLSGALSDRFGSRGISLLGLAVVVGGCLSMSGLHRDITVLEYIFRIVPLGLGLGLFISPNNSAIMGQVPRERLGVASGLMTLTRTLGHTTGIPLSGALFTAIVLKTSDSASMDITKMPVQALVNGVSGTYRVAAFICLVSAILAAAALWKSKRMAKAD